MLERLEPRQHLSATLAGKVLTIVGTDRADDIAIAAGKRKFVVHDNGTQTAFDVRAVKTIRIHGLRGDDSIIVSPKLPIRTSIEAGPGNDRIGGGAGDDTIFGDRGNDTLVGNAGNDYLDGGWDSDRLEAGDGFNVGHGGSGDDSSSSNYLPTSWVLRTGIESDSNSFISLETSSDQLTLVFAIPTVAEDVITLSQLEAREDGQHQLTFSVVTWPGIGLSPGTIYERRTITDAVGDGIVYTSEYGAFDPYTVPLFLPG